MPAIDSIFAGNIVTSERWTSLCAQQLLQLGPRVNRSDLGHLEWALWRKPRWQRWSPPPRRSHGSIRAYRARVRLRIEGLVATHVGRSQIQSPDYRPSRHARSSRRQGDSCTEYTLGRRDGAGILRAGW